MTISELMYRYTTHLSPDRIARMNANESCHDIIPHHVLLDNLPNGMKRIEKIMDILTHNHSGLTIYFEDSSEDISHILGEEFEKYKSPQLKEQYNIEGLTIQHILGVGYMVTTVDTFKSVMVNEYTLEEYEKRKHEYIIVALAKQEGHYIKDWVRYHLRIGIDRIYLYDNNDPDGERYDDLLEEYIRANQVVLIDIRGKSSIQNPIYNASYNALPFRWMIVLDVDEFLWFNETGHYVDVQNFLGDIGGCCGRDRYGVMLQWHCYVPSGLDHSSDKPIWEVNNKLLNFNARKDSRCEFIHEWCKSIYKPGYRISINEHFAWEYEDSDGNYNYRVMMVNWNGDPFTKEDLSTVTEKEFINQSAYIKHFLLRNIDDFFQRKYKRGHAGADFGKGQDGWRYWQWYQNMNYYTDITDNITYKEQDYMRSHGMKMNYTFHPDVYINLYTLDGNTYINESINKLLCDQILPHTNTFLTHIHILNPLNINQEYDANSLPKKRFNNNLSFMEKQVYTPNSHDLFLSDELLNVRKFKQDPIVFNIGIPPKFAYGKVSFDEQKQYIDILSSIFHWDTLRGLLRDVLEGDLTVLPQVGTNPIGSEKILGDSEFVNYMKQNELFLSEYTLHSNTLIMSFTEFQNYKNLVYNFIGSFGYLDNKTIYIDEQQGLPDHYHKLLSIIPSIFKNPYFIWKS